MDKRAIRRWRRDVFRTLRSIDQTWMPSHLSFACAIVLVGISAIGTDVSSLVELTGYAESFIVKVLRRARKTKLLIGQKMRTAWESDAGGIALILDALVIEGDVTRVPDPKRSTAAKARAARVEIGPRRPRTVVAKGAIFTPKQVKSNPWYLHSKYEKTT